MAGKPAFLIRVSFTGELGWEVDNFRDKGVTAKVNLALAELPAFEGLDGDVDVHKSDEKKIKRLLAER